MPIEWIVPAVALLLLIWAVIVHRRLVAIREAATEAWSEIDAEFRERQDLVSRLLEKIEGALGPESKTVRLLADARRAAASARSPEAIGKAEAALSVAIERALTRGAGQAGLRDDAAFRRLQSEFPEMEKRIDALRRFFNESVDDFNAARVGFPGAFLTFVINLPALEPLTVPKAAKPEAERTVQRL